MKSFVLITIFLASLWSAELDKFASLLDYKRDYKTALKTAKKEHKILMLVVVADYCPWCKKFERKTLKHESVDKIVKENFVAVIIDKFRDEGHYPKKFKSPLIPAIFFIDPESEEDIYKSLSYIKRRDFLYNIDEALKASKKRQDD